MVQLPTLQHRVQKREGLDPDQEVQHDPGRAIVGSVVEGPARVVGLHGQLVPLAEDGPPLVVQSANGLAQVPEHLWVREVDLLGLVVRQDPREDGVLGQVVEGPARKRVQLHQVVEVGQVALPPLRRVELGKGEPLAPGHDQDGGPQHRDALDRPFHLLPGLKGQEDAAVLQKNLASRMLQHVPHEVDLPNLADLNAQALRLAKGRVRGPLAEEVAVLLNLSGKVHPAAVNMQRPWNDPLGRHQLALR